MIFGFSHYPIGIRAPAKRATGDPADRGEEGSPASQTPAQVYDLAHQRRLRALQSTSSRAIRSMKRRVYGRINLTVLRWDDPRHRWASLRSESPAVTFPARNTDA